MCSSAELCVTLVRLATRCPSIHIFRQVRWGHCGAHTGKVGITLDGTPFLVVQIHRVLPLPLQSPHIPSPPPSMRHTLSLLSSDAWMLVCEGGECGGWIREWYHHTPVNALHGRRVWICLHWPGQKGMSWEADWGRWSPTSPQWVLYTPLMWKASYMGMAASCK